MPAFLYALTCLIVIGIISAVVVECHARKAQKIIMKHYMIDSKKGIWRSLDFEIMQSNLLINYLNDNNLYSDDKLKTLISYLEKNIEKSKSPSWWVAGIFLSLFAPIWLQYALRIFEYLKSWQFKDVTIFLICAIFVIIYIVACIGVLKKIIHLLQNFFPFEANFKKKFLEHLQDIHLTYEENYNLLEKESIVLKRGSSN